MSDGRRMGRGGMVWGMLNFLFLYGLVTVKLILAIGVVAFFLKFFNATSQLKQMTPLDIILNFLLGAILSDMILDDKITVLDFMVIVVIYGALLYLLNRLTFRTRIGRQIFVGSPRVIIQNGEFNAAMMKKMRINARDVAAAMRHQNIHSLKDVKTAQIEPNGTLTIIKRRAHEYPIILIDNGMIVTENLEKIGRTEKWLMKKLREKRVADPDDVFIAQYTRGHIQIIKK